MESLASPIFARNRNTLCNRNISITKFKKFDLQTTFSFSLFTGAICETGRIEVIRILVGRYICNSR